MLKLGDIGAVSNLVLGRGPRKLLLFNGLGRKVLCIFADKRNRLFAMPANCLEQPSANLPETRQIQRHLAGCLSMHILSIYDNVFITTEERENGDKPDFGGDTGLVLLPDTCPY